MWTLLTTEAIKVRRSAALRLAISAPVLLFLLELLTLFGRHTVNVTNPKALWTDLLTFSWIMWLGLFTPALVTAETICLANLEHAGRHWKQLFALPIPRWRIPAAKMLFCAILLSGSFALFVITAVAAVLIFSEVRGLNLAASGPWAETLLTTLRAFMACGLLIVVHTWISIRYPGFAVSAGVAFAAVMVGYLLLNVSYVYGWWYPWTLPLRVRPEGLFDPHNTWVPAIFGAVGGLALAPLAFWDLGRQQDEV